MASKKRVSGSRSLGRKVKIVKARGPAPAQPAARLKPVPRAAEPPAPALPSRRPWMRFVLPLLILALGVEVFLVLKGNVDRQATLVAVRMIGERGGPPETPGKFWGPGNIRVDRPRNRVAMIDNAFFKAIVWDTRSGALLAELDGQGRHTADPAKAVIAPGDFLPADGAFDRDGNLYVLDRTHARVTVFSPEYRVTGTWTVQAPVQDIAADPKEAILYIVDYASYNVVAYSPAGKELNRFGGDRLKDPGYLAVDDAGQVFVVDRGAKQVTVFSREGKFLRSWNLAFNPIGNPAIDVAQGNVYVSEHSSQRVRVYTPGGQLISDCVTWYPSVIGVDQEGQIYLSGSSGVNQFRLVKKAPGTAAGLYGK